MPPARSMTTTPGRCQRLTSAPFSEFVNEKMLIVVLGFNIQVNNVYDHQIKILMNLHLMIYIYNGSKGMRMSPTKNLQTPTDCLWKSVNNSTVELAEINSSFGKVSGSIWDPGSQATRKPLEILSTNHSY